MTNPHIAMAEKWVADNPATLKVLQELPYAAIRHFKVLTGCSNCSQCYTKSGEVQCTLLDSAKSPMDVIKWVRQNNGVPFNCLDGCPKFSIADDTLKNLGAQALLAFNPQITSR